MTDTVTTQILRDGRRNAIIKFTNISDGSGEAGVIKVDVSALSESPTSVKITRIDYTTAGIGLDVLWGANTNVLAFTIPQDTSDSLDYKWFGGLHNDAGAGKTGDVLFSTNNSPLAGDRYTVVLHMVKGYG